MTVQGANVVSVMIGLTIGQMVLPVGETVGDLMVEIVVGNLDIRDLVVILPHGGLVMRSLLFMRSVGILEAPGAKGEVAGVEALQRGHPLPVVALQPREDHRRLGTLALARLPMNGALSTLYASGPHLSGRGCPMRTNRNIWVKLPQGTRKSRLGTSSGITEIYVLNICD